MSSEGPSAGMSANPQKKKKKSGKKKRSLNFEEEADLSTCMEETMRQLAEEYVKQRSKKVKRSHPTASNKANSTLLSEKESRQSLLNPDIDKRQSEKAASSGKRACDNDELFDDDVIGADNDHDDTWSEGEDWLDECPSDVISGSRQLEKFKSYVGITSADIAAVKLRKKRQSDDKSRVVGICANAGRPTLQRAAPEVVVFEDPAKRNKLKSQTAPATKTNPARPKASGGALGGDSRRPRDDDGYPDNDSDSADEDDFDMERARYEIRRFAINGMKGAEKEKNMTNLLVKLGAKAPKNEYLNYKVFQEAKKEERTAQIERDAFERAVGNKVINPNRRKKYIKQKPSDRNDVGAIDGQIGRYKHGLQHLKRRDIEAVKKQGKRPR